MGCGWCVCGTCSCACFRRRALGCVRTTLICPALILSLRASVFGKFSDPSILFQRFALPSSLGEPLSPLSCNFRNQAFWGCELGDFCGQSLFSKLTALYLRMCTYACTDLCLFVCVWVYAYVVRTYVKCTYLYTYRYM